MNTILKEFHRLRELFFLLHKTRSLRTGHSITSKVSFIVIPAIISVTPRDALLQADRVHIHHLAKCKTIETFSTKATFFFLRLETPKIPQVL